MHTRSAWSTFKAPGPGHASYAESLRLQGFHGPRACTSSSSADTTMLEKKTSAFSSLAASSRSRLLRERPTYACAAAWGQTHELQT